MAHGFIYVNVFRIKEDILPQNLLKDTKIFFDGVVITPIHCVVVFFRPLIYHMYYLDSKNLSLLP